MGDTLFNLGHVPLQDDTLDAFYARDIEQQLDVQALVVESGPQSADILELPELGKQVSYHDEHGADKLYRG